MDRFCEWLRTAAIGCLGTKGYRITFTVYLPGPRSTLIPRLKDFLGSPQGQPVTQAAIEHALRGREQGRHAAMIGDASVLPDPSLFHDASQAYVEPIVPADPAEVNCEFEEPGTGGQWHPFIPMSAWTNTQAIINAIADKRAKLTKYRELATVSNAHALWLLLVVEQSSGWDVLGALRGDEKDRLHATLAEQPQFDEIYLLAQMPGYPWQLRKLWPVAQAAP